MRGCMSLLALLALGLASPARAEDSKLKACFIYVGPVGDIGWSYAHDEARKLTEKALPWLETQYVEAVPEGQALPVIDRLVTKGGCKVVLTTSFGFMDQTLEAAKKYPQVVFAHTAGFKRAPNMATYMADFYQVYYLNGLMAGALTKTGQGGLRGGVPHPRAQAPHLRVRAGRARGEPEGHGEREVDQRLGQPGEGARGGRGADGRGQ